MSLVTLFWNTKLIHYSYNTKHLFQENVINGTFGEHWLCRVVTEEGESQLTLEARAEAKIDLAMPCMEEEDWGSTKTTMIWIIYPGYEKVSQIYLAVCVFSLCPPTGKEKTSLTLTYRLYCMREDPTAGDSSMKETDKHGILRPPMSDWCNIHLMKKAMTLSCQRFP